MVHQVLHQGSARVVAAGRAAVWEFHDQRWIVFLRTQVRWSMPCKGVRMAASVPPPTCPRQQLSCGGPDARSVACG